MFQLCSQWMFVWLQAFVISQNHRALDKNSHQAEVGIKKIKILVESNKHAITFAVLISLWAIRLLWMIESTFAMP